MNSLIHTKRMVSGHRTAIRQYYSFKLWHNTNQINGNLAFIYMGRRDTRNNILLLNSTITENRNSNNLSYVQSRSLYITPTWHGQESSSKVEDTVKNIKRTKRKKK